MNIRPETKADVDAIAEVTKAAFLEAEHTSHTEQFIVEALRRTEQLSVSLVAEESDVVIGHVAVSPVTLSSGANGWFGIGPLSVLPAWQGKGVGTQLMHEALRTLKARDAGGCVLLGDPSYYQRFGFRPVSSLLLEGVPPEYFQALCFGTHYPEATVTYHDAFNANC